jgi:hypothetical protein
MQWFLNEICFHVCKAYESCLHAVGTGLAMLHSSYLPKAEARITYLACMWRQELGGIIFSDCRGKDRIRLLKSKYHIYHSKIYLDVQTTTTKF